MQFGVQNGLQTGFQNNFQTGNNLNNFNNFNNFNNQEEEEENKRYPKLNKEQLGRLEQLADEQGLTGKAKQDYMDKTYQEIIPAINNQNTLDKRQEEINRSHSEENDGDISKREIKRQKNRLMDLAQQVKTVYPDLFAADEDDESVIQDFIVGLMNAGYSDAYKDYAEYIKSGDKDVFFSKYNLSNSTTSVEDETGLPVGGIMSALAGAGIYGGSYLGKPVERWGKNIYGNVIPTSDYEAQQLERAGELNKELELDIKDQKAEVKRLKKEVRNAVGEEKVQLQAQLDEAKDALTKLKETPKKEVRTAVDTALEENLVGTKKGVAEEAGAIRNRIWKKQIQTEIDAHPDVKIKLKDAFSEFVEEAKGSVAELDNMKKEEMSRALKKLEKWYNRNSDLENATLQQVQDLKSSIQKTLKDVYEKQAKQGEISTFDKLLEKYASKLRTKLQEKLQELAPNKNIKDLYKKWAENDMIAEQGIKENLLKGNVKENFIKKGRQQLESRVGKSLVKQGKRADALKEFVNKTAKKLGTKGKGLLKGIVKGGRLFTILEDGTLIPGSPTNLASEALETAMQAYEDENSVYKGKTNGIDMIWDKEKVDKAIEKRGKGDGTFLDRYGNLFKLNDDGTISEIL